MYWLSHSLSVRYIKTTHLIKKETKKKQKKKQTNQKTKKKKKKKKTANLQILWPDLPFNM